MSHLPQNHRLVSSGELTKTKSQNPAQGRRSKAEGNRQRWIRTLMQFLWMILSVFIRIWLLCFTSKVYMKIIVLDLWDDSSWIQFKEEYSNLLEEEKEVLNLTKLVWNEKNNESKNVFNRICTKRYQSVLSSQLKFIQRQLRRNNPIEFLWYTDIIRMISQNFTTPQKFWSLDQPLHRVP